MEADTEKDEVARIFPDEETGALSLKISDLNVPRAQFYANTAVAVGREDMLSYVFGVFRAGTTAEVEAAIGFDMGRHLIATLAESFNENFRSRLAKASSLYGAMHRFPGTAGRTETYLAHLARAVVNENWAWVDFYEFSSDDEKPGIRVAPIVRIKMMPAVLKYFVDRVDQEAKQR